MHANSMTRAQIVNATLIMEAVLLLVAALFVQVCQLPLKGLFHCNQRILLLGIGSGAGIATSSFCLLWLGRKLPRVFPWLERLQQIVVEDLLSLFQSLTFGDIILIAGSSGFCEEVLFRGICQTWIGLLIGDKIFSGDLSSAPAILVSAAIFGVLHCPGDRFLPYGFWAFCAGIFLGWLLLFSHSLWPPIIAHALSNFLVLLILRYRPGLANR